MESGCRLPSGSRTDTHSLKYCRFAWFPFKAFLCQCWDNRQAYCSKRYVWPDLIWAGLRDGQHVLESFLHELGVSAKAHGRFILSPVIFAACFPLLRVALPEGVLQTPAGRAFPTRSVLQTETQHRQHSAAVELGTTSERSLCPACTAAPRGFSPHLCLRGRNATLPLHPIPLCIFSPN